jgi:hypothetical protein
MALRALSSAEGLAQRIPELSLGLINAPLLAVFLRKMSDDILEMITAGIQNPTAARTTLAKHGTHHSVI